MHEHLCIISAISPHAGPRFLFDEDDLETVIHDMTSEIKSMEPNMVTISIPELKDILKDALLSTEPGSALNSLGWHPPGFRFQKYEADRFSISSRNICYLFQRSKNGSVEILCVDEYDQEVSAWRELITEDENGQRTRKLGSWSSGTRDGDPFFCREIPYLYLKKWTHKEEDEHFPQKFFDLVNSHRGPAFTKDGDFVSGVLPCIEYEGLEKANMSGFQDDLGLVRNGSKHTFQAIMSGKRGPELWTALAHDFGAWMAVRPDIWPSPSAEGLRPAPTIHGVIMKTATQWDKLPNELLLQILNLVSISSLLALCATSHTMHRLIASLLDQVLFYQVRHGNLFWVLPVSAVPGEVRRAHGTAALWLKSSGDSTVSSEKSPFDTPQFPFFLFVRECVSNSFSMLSRRRLWNVCAQFDQLGREDGYWE